MKTENGRRKTEDGGRKTEDARSRIPSPSSDLCPPSSSLPKGTQTRYRDPQLTHWIAGRFTREEKAFLENAVDLAGPWRKPRRLPLGMFADAGRFIRLPSSVLRPPTSIP